MISVIIPTFNEEENIAQCLVSLSHQSMPRSEYEIIVVDGGSKDATCEIAKKYADLVFTQTSKKVGGARNDGVMAASGGYCCYDGCRLHSAAALAQAAFKRGFRDP